MDIEQDLAKIARQEKTLCFENFDENIAWELGCRLRDAAVKRGAALVIDVSAGGHSLFACAMPGSSPNNANWVRRKRNTALHFQCCSYAIGLQLQRDKSDFSTKFGLPLADYATAGGSFPIRISSAGVIGAITVSGLPQREDHKFVVQVLAEFLGKSVSDAQLE